METEIKEQAYRIGHLNILEAGCGMMWGLDLGAIDYTLTGVDINKDAIEMRAHKQKDLDIGIIGDLRTVRLNENEYNVIYNSYVLEHIEGADTVLNNFIKWLKPGGILLLRIPNRDSCKGFVTRITPFWLHVIYRKYVHGERNAGKPGFSPFPTFFDSVVSRTGIHKFCNDNGLVLKSEYVGGFYRKNRSIFMGLERFLEWFLLAGSLGKLSAKHVLIYVIEKRPNGTNSAKSQES